RRVVAMRAGDVEMRMAGAAAAAQLAARQGGALLHVVRRDGKALHLHPHDRVRVALVFLAFGERLALAAEEARRIGGIGAVEIAGPQIVRLHHVKVAVEDQKTVARHVVPPGRQPLIRYFSTKAQSISSPKPGASPIVRCPSRSCGWLPNRPKASGSLSAPPCDSTPQAQRGRARTR